MERTAADLSRESPRTNKCGNPFLGWLCCSFCWSCSSSSGGTVPRSNSSAGEDAKKGRVDSCPRLELLFSGALVRPRDEYWAIEPRLARAFQAVPSFSRSRFVDSLPLFPSLFLQRSALSHCRESATLFHRVDEIAQSRQYAPLNLLS